MNSEDKPLSLLKNKDMQQEYRVNPDTLKWLAGLIFILGSLYVSIKDIPRLKDDVRNLQIKNESLLSWRDGNDKRLDRMENKIDIILQRTNSNYTNGK